MFATDNTDDPIANSGQPPTTPNNPVGQSINPTGPTDQPAGSVNKKSPLDILEEILQDKKQADLAARAAQAPAKPTGLSPADLQAQSEQQSQAQFEALNEQHRQEDEMAIRAQLAKLKDVEETPEKLARIDLLFQEKPRQDYGVDRLHLA